MKKTLQTALFLLAAFGFFGFSSSAMAKCNFVGKITNKTGKLIKVYKVVTWEKVNYSTIVMNKDRKLNNNSTMTVRKTLSGWWGKKCGKMKVQLRVYFSCDGSKTKHWFYAGKKQGKGRRVTNSATITGCKTVYNN